MKIRMNSNKYIHSIVDLIVLFLSFYLSYQIRFDFDIHEVAWSRFKEILPFVMGVKFFFFFYFDLFKRMWRYTSLNDLFNIVKACTGSTLCIIVLVLYVNRFENLSRSVFIIDWCLAMIFIIGLRVSVRLMFAQFTENIGLKEIKQFLFQLANVRLNEGKKILIIGAGDCGEMVCREFRENASIQSSVVGFLDDDKSKTGRKIHGLPVLGTIDELESIVESTGVEEIIIAIPSANAESMRRIVDFCGEAEVTYKTVPDMGEVIDGRISFSSIRAIEYRDLLGRKPVKLDKVEIGRYLAGKTVLVTGAAGSIGQGLCKQICRYNPGKIVLYEWAESPLYEIDIELKKNFSNIEIVPVLGDIQNETELRKIFKKYKPNIVFHAAAYKHVPMLERYPWKAIENNVFGTKNLVKASDEFSCEKFVFVSTDKAVNPFNIMGTSKRIAEMIVQNQNLISSSHTSFITVRFGNVIGSVGSVIPLFKQQIKDGGPVTVTHPEMIRFFMLIPEACQLILQAGSMGKGGEIFILEMGEPVKIDNMARDLIKLSGLEPDRDIKIKYTGLRPGEKLYEELMTNQENVVPTGHSKIMVLNSRKVNLEELNENLVRLRRSSEERNKTNIRNLFKEIVPEYQPNPGNQEG